MKKRRVMRLLAVVMAAVVVVTSQGVPAGLTEVEAAVATQNGLTAGHLYQEVTKTSGDNGGEDTYTYKPISLVSGVATEGNSVSVAQSDVIQDTSQENKYYIDVTKNFVTGIRVNQYTQYVTSSTEESDLSDNVTLTFGVTGYTQDNAWMYQSYVTSDFTKDGDYDGTSGNVKISSITNDDRYMYNTDYKASTYTIVTTENTKPLSNISKEEFSADSVTGLTTVSASYTVKKVSAPEMSLSEPTGDTAISDISEKKAFDVTEGSVTVRKPSITLGDDAEDWKFQWEDETATSNGIMIHGSTWGSYSALSDYTLSASDTLGNHKVYLTAYYKGQKVATSNVVEFYVLKQVDIEVATTYVTAGTTSEQIIDLTSLLTAYSDRSTFTASKDLPTATENKITDNKAVFTGSDNKVKFTPTSVAQGDTLEFKGTISSTAYIVNLTIPVEGIASGTTISNPTLTAQSIYYSDKVVEATLFGNMIANYAGNESCYTVTYGNDTNKTVPTEVGTTVVYVTYKNTTSNEYGSATTTLTVKKKPLTIKALAQTVTQGGSVSNTKYTVSTTGNAGDPVTELPDGLIATPEIDETEEVDTTNGISNVPVGEYDYYYVISGTGVENYDISRSYDDTYAILTIEAAPATPSADTNKDKKPSNTTTTEPTITENEDGTKVIVDADGKAIANELVTTSDGKSYVTDENGEVLTSQIAETGDIKVYVDKDGVVATNKAVTTEDGKKYYATETGEIATNSFVETARGNKVYATKTGELKTSTAFTVNGKKYYAKASGAIATTGFVKTAKGNTVYATKSGALQVNKAFKASNGKKYVADKNGKIVKGKKITIGNKTYTTNKKGVIIKVTTKK